MLPIERPHARTILVVDDDEGSVRLLTRVLGAEGFLVVSAGTGDAAMDAIAAREPDLVIVDIVIPSPNGFEVCERLKKDRATRGIPVIVMSGLQHPANIARSRALGASAFLAKPLDLQEVVTCVRRIFKPGGAGA